MRTARFKLRKLVCAPVCLKVRVSLNKVCQRTAAFPVRMVRASLDSKPPAPTMVVKFKKPLFFKSAKKLIVNGKAVAKSEQRLVTLTGDLFHWGGQIFLVCHRSPWHPNEWMVSEYTTGIGSHFSHVQKPVTMLKLGQCPTEAEARFEAIFFFQRLGMKAVSAFYQKAKKINRISEKMRRYVATDWNWNERTY